MADILMVCVRQDVARAKALAEMFLSAGYSIDDRHAGDAALRSSAAAILVWSRDSIRSALFRDAARRAVRTGRALIVNLLGPSSRPARIGCSPIFDLARWRGDRDDAVLDPLRRTVAAMVKDLRNQIEHWRAIRHSDETSDFVDYLARYGLDAAFSDAAEQRLDEIAFGALVGVPAPAAKLEPVMADANVRSPRGRARRSAAAYEAHTDDPSAPRGGAPRDESAAPTPHASKRRSGSHPSRSATLSGQARESVFAVAYERVATSLEAWRRRGAASLETLRSLRSVRAAAAHLALDVRRLQRWAVARLKSFGGAEPAGDGCKSAHAGEQKFVAAPANVRNSRRASAKAPPPSPPRRATPVMSWSAIERAIARSSILGGRMARSPIVIAPLVAGAALAGVLYFTGAASNLARSEPDIGIADARPGDIVYFDEPEPADRTAAPPARALHAPPAPAAARRAGKGKRAMTISRAAPLGAAPSISMRSNDASASAAPPDAALRAPSDTESLLSSASLATGRVGFDLAPDLPQPSQNWPSNASIGAAFRSGDPVWTSPLGDAAIDDAPRGARLLLPAQERALCADAASRPDAELHGPPAQDRSGFSCAEP